MGDQSNPRQLVEQVDRLLNDCSISEAIDELSDALSKLAVQLRDESIRSELEDTNLPVDLVRALHRYEVDPKRGNVLEQVGRVAANLGADNPNNLEHLLKAGYPQYVIRCLTAADTVAGVSLPTARALVASLLNAVVSDHVPTKTVLSGNTKTLRSLIEMAGSFMNPTREGGDERDAWAGFGVWVWRVIEELAEHNPSSLSESLSEDLATSFLLPLSAFMPISDAEDRTPTSEDGQSSLLAALEHCCNCLTTLSELDPDDSHATEAALHPARPFIDQPKALSTLLDFVELARIPNDWTFESPAEASSDENEASGMTQDDCEKRLGKAKASAIRMIIHISWDISYDPESTFWKRISEWTAKGTERDDLVSCGLLSIGNGAKNGEIAESLLREPSSILSSLVSILAPKTKVTTQHAVISLLRNLAIPPANKTALGKAGVIDRIVDMGVFGETRDMVETVQGGSAVVLKLVCQVNATNAESFALNEKAVNEVIAVIKRVDTPAVGFEASRIFANSIKSLTSDQNKHIEAVARLSQPDVIEVFVALLRRTVKYPLLTNDAIISLALVTTFGPDGSAESVLEELRKEQEVKSEEEVSSGKEVLARIVSTGEDTFSKEIRANTATLLTQLKERTGGDLLQS